MYASNTEENEVLLGVKIAEVMGCEGSEWLTRQWMKVLWPDCEEAEPSHGRESIRIIENKKNSVFAIFVNLKDVDLDWVHRAFCAWIYKDPIMGMKII